MLVSTRRRRLVGAIFLSSAVLIAFLSAHITQAGTQGATGSGCAGKMSGAVTGSFTCESAALFFLPSYKDAAAKGNTQVSLMRSARLQKGTPPSGVDALTWAGVFRGPLQPGTYTEKDLVKTMFDAASVRLTAHKSFGDVRRVKLVVKSVSPGAIHEDVVTKQGSTRADQLTGELDLVIGDAAGEVALQVTLN